MSEQQVKLKEACKRYYNIASYYKEVAWRKRKQ